MRIPLPSQPAAAALAVALLLFFADDAEAQRPGGQESPSVQVEFSISAGDQERIREFYSSHPRSDAQGLPPGIRRNLERGKSLPPGIAKRVPPEGLRSMVTVPERLEIVEVGLDVLLVEVATGIIHDVLMDVIR